MSEKKRSGLTAFLDGFGSAVDLFGVRLGTGDSQRPAGQMGDAMALRSDWFAVGDDIRKAIAEEERRGKEVGAPR